MWLLINIHEKQNYNYKSFTASAFLVYSADWLKQTITFVKFKLFQDQCFQNYSVKNLEICKDWFYMITSLLKITRFTIISSAKVSVWLWELSVYKKHLQEVYCRFEVRRTLRAARDKRHLLSCLTTVQCSSLSVPEIQNPEMKEAICFLLTLSSMGEWSNSCCEVGNCRYWYNICFFSALGFH